MHSRSTPGTPADKTYASQLKGAAISRGDQLRQPQHRRGALPDHPTLSADHKQRHRAARRYAKIAPMRPTPAHAVAHLHPRRLLSGIDRSGMASGQSAKAAGDFHEQLHAMTTWSMPTCSSVGQESPGRHRRRTPSPASPAPSPSVRVAISPARYAVNAATEGGSGA